MATSGFAGSIFTGVYTGGGNAGANSIFITQVTLARAATVSAVLLNVVTAASGIQFKALIYDSAHSVLLGAGSTATAVAAGYNRFALTAPVSLSAGNYYVGYVANSGVQVSIAGGGTSWFVSGGQSVASPPNPLVGGSSNGSNLAVALEFDGSTAAAYGYSPVDYTTGVTLSASNTVATTTTAANMCARSVVTHDAAGGGKYYAEVAISGTLGANVQIGINSAGSAIAGAQANANKIAEFLTSTGLASGIAGTNTNTGITFVTGDVIGVAYDAGAGLLWFNKNGGSWGGVGAGDPVAGTNGLAITPGNWPFMVVAGNNAAGTFTLRDRASDQTYTRPSGYSAWSAATATVAARQYAVTVNSG